MHTDYSTPIFYKIIWKETNHYILNLAILFVRKSVWSIENSINSELFQKIGLKLKI